MNAKEDDEEKEEEEETREKEVKQFKHCKQKIKVFKEWERVSIKKQKRVWAADIWMCSILRPK